MLTFHQVRLANTLIRTLFLVAACLVIGLPGASADIVADTVFNNSDWTLTVVGKNNGGSVSGNQITTGGNPTAARQVSHGVSAGTTASPSSVFGLHVFNSAVNPATTNLGQIGFSIDYDFVFNPFATGNVGAGALVQQNGRFYGANFLGFGDPANGGYDTITAYLQESDFLEIDLSNTNPLFINGSNPDFSSGGTTINFGFITGNSNSPANPVAYDATYNFDNFKISAKAVPEPGALSLILLGMVCSLAARRRRAYVLAN